jgi:5'-methylthioadenosine phosphorylase
MATSIKPVHIQLNEGELAERVLIAGDPERIKNISRLLTNPKLLNKYRYVVYTGEYKGKRVSLASHGIGAPSLAIAVEELHAFGGKTFIRLGTCGGALKEQKYGDLIIPDAAFSVGGGTIGSYVNDSKKAFRPDESLTSKLINEVKSQGKRHFVGSVFSSDAFFAENEDVKKLSGKIVGVEMECATLFMLAELRKFKAASLLMVVDNQLENVPFLAVEDMHRLATATATIVLDTLIES